MSVETITLLPVLEAQDCRNNTQWICCTVPLSIRAWRDVKKLRNTLGHRRLGFAKFIRRQCFRERPSGSNIARIVSCIRLWVSPVNYHITASWARRLIVAKFRMSSSRPFLGVSRMNGIFLSIEFPSMTEAFLSDHAFADVCMAVKTGTNPPTASLAWTIPTDDIPRIWSSSLMLRQVLPLLRYYDLL